MKQEQGPLREVVNRWKGLGAGWERLECGHKMRATGSRVTRRRRCRDCLNERGGD